MRVSACVDNAALAVDKWRRVTAEFVFITSSRIDKALLINDLDDSCPVTQLEGGTFRLRLVTTDEGDGIVTTLLRNTCLTVILMAPYASHQGKLRAGGSPAPRYARDQGRIRMTAG